MQQKLLHFPDMNDAESRVFLLSAIALSASVFNVAFWYGVFGTVFFETLFTIWVIATSALLATLFIKRSVSLPPGLRWERRSVLALPTVWLVLEASLVITDADPRGFATWAAGIVMLGVSFLTLPYLVYILVIAVVPDIDRLQKLQHRLALVLVTIVIAIAGIVIGAHHDLFLTCEDFKVSGSDLPIDCRPGEPVFEPKLSQLPLGRLTAWPQA